MKVVGTSIDEVTYEAMLKKYTKLRITRSEYLRMLICADLGVVNTSSRQFSIWDRLKRVFRE